MSTVEAETQSAIEAIDTEHETSIDAIYLEDVFGPYELVDGQLRFNTKGEKGHIPKNLTKRKAGFGGLIDFVILESNGTYRLVLGRNHSGLSGGRAYVHGAGEILVNGDGFVIELINGSGHYLPSEDSLRNAIRLLTERGILSPSRPIKITIK